MVIPSFFVMMSTNINLIVWNCRCAVGKAFYRYSKFYIDMYKPIVFMVMETR